MIDPSTTLPSESISASLIVAPAAFVKLIDGIVSYPDPDDCTLIPVTWPVASSTVTVAFAIEPEGSAGVSNTTTGGLAEV